MFLNRGRSIEPENVPAPFEMEAPRSVPGYVFVFLLIFGSVSMLIITAIVILDENGSHGDVVAFLWGLVKWGFIIGGYFLYRSIYRTHFIFDPHAKKLFFRRIIVGKPFYREVADYADIQCFRIEILFNTDPETGHSSISHTVLTAFLKDHSRIVLARSPFFWSTPSTRFRSLMLSLSRITGRPYEETPYYPKGLEIIRNFRADMKWL